MVRRLSLLYAQVVGERGTLSTPDHHAEPSTHKVSLHVDFNTLRAKLGRAVDHWRESQRNWDRLV